MWRADDLDALVNETIADLDRWLGLDDTDLDEAVYPVIQVIVNPDGRPVFQRLRPDIERHPRRMRSYLFPPVGSNARGIWVDGPRTQAVDIARSLGLRGITEGERHGRGRPHVHGISGRRRSQHIFYGRRVPALGENFFD